MRTSASNSLRLGKILGNLASTQEEGHLSTETAPALQCCCVSVGAMVLGILESDRERKKEPEVSSAMHAPTLRRKTPKKRRRVGDMDSGQHPPGSGSSRGGRREELGRATSRGEVEMGRPCGYDGTVPRKQLGFESNSLEGRHLEARI